MDSEHTIDSDIGLTPVDVDATELVEQRHVYTVKSGVLFHWFNPFPDVAGYIRHETFLL